MGLKARERTLLTYFSHNVLGPSQALKSRVSVSSAGYDAFRSSAGTCYVLWPIFK